jgi:hypothetical protein
MITLTITTLLAFTLIASYALARAYKHAPDGYEDETGFHHGIMPRTQVAAAHAAPSYTDSKRAA